jgi:hypothetical protein
MLPASAPRWPIRGRSKALRASGPAWAFRFRRPRSRQINTTCGAAFQGKTFDACRRRRYPRHRLVPSGGPAIIGKSGSGSRCRGDSCLLAPPGRTAADALETVSRREVPDLPDRIVGVPRSATQPNLPPRFHPVDKPPGPFPQWSKLRPPSRLANAILGKKLPTNHVRYTSAKSHDRVITVERQRWCLVRRTHPPPSLHTELRSRSRTGGLDLIRHHPGL